MTHIRQEDLIQSVADALQFISYYHPADYIRALGEAYELEQSPAAKDAMAQILVNSRMCAEGHRPICQDTGMVVAFLKVGMGVRFEGNLSLQAMVDEGVRRAYTHPDNLLRASMVSDPIGARKNTGDNTPAIVHCELVPGDRVEVKLAAKGGGSENKARFAVLNPSDSLADWVLRTVPTLGAGWCPPGMLGIGVGGSAEKAMLLAKEALMADIDIHELRRRGADKPSGGAAPGDLRQGQRAGDRRPGPRRPDHGPGRQDPRLPHPRRLPAGGHHPQLRRHPARRIHPGRQRTGGPGSAAPGRLAADRLRRRRRRPPASNLDSITRGAIAAWRPGDRLLLSGKLLTGRDAAHKRLVDLLSRGEPLPDGVDLKGRFIYYVGPVDPVGDEVVGPAGPTTATRMDKFTEQVLAQTGLIGMIGKAERGPAGIEAIKRHGAVYLIAVGGAAYLVAKAIKASRVVAFPDLGMEAIREFEVEAMPVTVAVDSRGESIHQSGPAEWRSRIGKIPVTLG